MAKINDARIADALEAINEKLGGVDANLEAVSDKLGYIIDAFSSLEGTIDRVALEIGRK